MACIKNDNLYFQYAAYIMALRYCLENVLMKNEVRFKALKTTINPGIIENYKESQRFWEQYDTFIDKGFHAFYDQFLKVNQQKDGLESYSKFVDLLINYYDTEKVALLLVSNLSKASFKVGFASIDKRLNHFMIDTNAENYIVFMSELFKYLKILNKI
jgi:hypothetical protein